MGETMKLIVACLPKREEVEFNYSGDSWSLANLCLCGSQIGSSRSSHQPLEAIHGQDAGVR